MSLATIHEYLDYLGRQSYPALFNEEALQKLGYIRQQFGSLSTEETILEIDLNGPRQCDYSIRVDLESGLVGEYWYELDSAACKETELLPCYFIDATRVIPGQENTDFYETALVRLAGEDRLKKLTPMLRRCVAGLEGRCPSLFQLGAMTGRGQQDSLRLFTQDMTRKDLVEYLAELNWPGDLKALDVWLEQLEPYSDRGLFILDFDLYENHISEKIGINLGTRKKTPSTIAAWLEFLGQKGLCKKQKADDVLRFVSAYPSHTPFIQNDISHFKLAFEHGKVSKAKAYLRQGGKCFVPSFKAYESPVLMNLELTSRCPLRCPQCYCDLNRGKDLPLETALYWVEQAALNKVKTINLSGGETMCYPGIYRLIEACHTAGIEANIAISGWGITPETVGRLIESGVADICVSLNGSTEEINRQSRDGYDLAVNALELLKAAAFPRVHINWVMHSFNAEDFPNIVELARQYHVQTVVVMVFKPNANHEMPSVPSAEQMQRLAAWIKKYKGPVQIEAEECFSQMRALLGQRFFVNTNQGINRGCGAGRDGVSVSVDGKLTPCRHLELEETQTSLRDYWMNSAVLQTLRRADDDPQESCRQCQFRRYCLPCMAVNWKMHGKLYMGDTGCPIRPTNREESV